MNLGIYDMREKQVVCIKDGTILGYLSDVEIDTETGRLVSIIIFGKRMLGIFGRENDQRIAWENIKVIGEDSILVDCDGFYQVKPKSRSTSFISDVLKLN